MQNEGNFEVKINVRVTREIENIWKADRGWQLSNITYKLVGCACRTEGRLST